MAIRAYADENGIGIFDKQGDEPSYDTPMDLRLDDMDSFLAFVSELLAASKKMGWFKKTTVLFTLKKEQ